MAGGGSGEGMATTGEGGGGARSSLLTSMPPPSIRGSLDPVLPDHQDSRLGLSPQVPSATSHSHQVLLHTEGRGVVRSMPQFINGTDVMMSSSHSMRTPGLAAAVVDDDDRVEQACPSGPDVKKARLDSSPGNSSQ